MRKVSDMLWYQRRAFVLIPGVPSSTTYISIYSIEGALCDRATERGLILENIGEQGGDTALRAWEGLALAFSRNAQTWRNSTIDFVP